MERKETLLKKAALTIGVNKTGNYTPLKSAAPRCSRDAKWLTDQGYEVTCLTPVFKGRDPYK